MTTRPPADPAPSTGRHAEPYFADMSADEDRDEDSDEDTDSHDDG